MKIKKDRKNKNISLLDIVDKGAPILGISVIVLGMSLLLGICYSMFWILIGGLTHPMIGILPSAVFCVLTGMYFGERFDENNHIFTDEVIFSLVGFLTAQIGTIIICLAMKFI